MRSRVATAATVATLALGGACAHTNDQVDAPKSDENESAVLRERVLRLERKLSDMDAQLAALTERLDGGAGSVSVGSGAYPAYSQPPAPAPAPAYVDEPAPARWTDQPIYSGRSVDIERTVSEEPPEEPAPMAWDTPSGEGEDAAFDAATPPAYTATASPAAAPAAAPAAQLGVDELYKWARDRQQDGRYLEAVAAYEEVLSRFPRHHLADNALYWTAVCHLDRGEPRAAVAVWKKLPLRFPKSPKMPDSLFGMAQAHEKLGEPVVAETLYSQLLDQYPKAERTAAARQALKRLGGAPDARR